MECSLSGSSVHGISQARILFPESPDNRCSLKRLIVSVLLLQSCLTLCDPLDCSPPGFSVYGIFPVKILAWVAMLSSRGSSQPRDRTRDSCVSCIGGRFFTAEPRTPSNRFKRLKTFFLLRCAFVAAHGLFTAACRLSLVVRASLVVEHGL